MWKYCTHVKDMKKSVYLLRAAEAFLQYIVSRTEGTVRGGSRTDEYVWYMVRFYLSSSYRYYESVEFVPVVLCIITQSINSEVFRGISNLARYINSKAAPRATFFLLLLFCVRGPHVGEKTRTGRGCLCKK